ncbi:hypothetical protein [Roseateles sp. BYS96W]|uniref:Porin n=1 Tax=Pelomonas nitida TaxID=3299027 RepID=A0ABW7GA56_9BURK
MTEFLRSPRRRLPGALAAALLSMLGAEPEPALGQDLSWSAFGTLGYARSNRDYAYRRHIDSDGTLQADSVLGGQADLRFGPQWSATVQLRAAPSLKSDARWDLTPAWAFLAWRPGDDWLLRAGKMRVPLYLNSEVMDVGVTYDLARLPQEMYSIVPSTDFVGAAAARTWMLGERELALDAYAGEIGTTARFWLRDGVPPQMAAGANFRDIRVQSAGLVLTMRSVNGTWRAGVHGARTSMRSGAPMVVSYPFVEVAPGLGYYQVSDQLPGPGARVTGSVRNLIYTVGVDQALAPGWRLMGEFAANVQRGTELGSDSRGGYVALLRTVGRFTPYASWARLKSSDGRLDWAQRLTTQRLPATIPGAALINAAQRAAGETGYAVDQSTLALGGSYGVRPGQKVKLEWAHTRIGRLSRFVDTLPGSETPSRTGIDVLSASYSFSF